MIIIVFGHTFFLLFNLPLKEYGQWNLYKMMSSFFYVIPMSGLRYIPRFLLSCSGFTFTYKYLSFLDRNSTNYFLKFLFQQNYKYLLLIIIFLGRPLMYFIHFCLIGNNPMGELLNYLLKKPNQLNDFMLSLLLFKLTDNFKSYMRNSRDLFDYFWLPFNEVFCFIIGLILISICYRFKLRIDLIIIISFILLYLLKIVIYYYYFFIKKEEFYSTLYYYIIDYGKLMLLPYFNLSYYLIGMFFGLMQYTLHKIMTEIEQNRYESINLIEDSNLLKDEEKKMILNMHKINSDNRITYNNNLFSFANKKEKESCNFGKNLDTKLLESKTFRNKRNASVSISNNLLEYDFDNCFNPSLIKTSSSHCGVF